MSVQLALLKSGEEVIADIKEFRDSKDDLVSYLFKDPHCIKINTEQLLIESESAPKHEVVFYKWMSLSKDTDIIVNKDWVVCITDPLDAIAVSYEGRNDGRNESSDGRDDAPSATTTGGDNTDSGVVFNESVDFNQ